MARRVQSRDVMPELGGDYTTSAFKMINYAAPPPNSHVEPFSPVQPATLLSSSSSSSTSAGGGPPTLFAVPVQAVGGGGRRGYGTTLLVVLAFVVALTTLPFFFSASPLTSSSSPEVIYVEVAPSTVPTCAPPANHSTEPGHDGRVLVVYAYFEKDAQYKRNMEVFLAVGVSERADVDYIIVVQGNASIQFPQLKNLKVIRRPNDCLDMGAWRVGLDNVTNWRDGYYRYFIFINTSLRGPFLPTYVSPSTHWTRLFTQMLGSGNGNAQPGPVKLVGISINCISNDPHVQSMVWATDLEALTFVIDKTHVLECKKDIYDAITNGELLLSRSVLAQGWNIASMITAYRGWDFRVQKSCNNGRDPNIPEWYFGIEPEIYETMFIKTNRKMHERELEVYTQMILQQAQKGRFERL